MHTSPSVTADPPRPTPTAPAAPQTYAPRPPGSEALASQAFAAFKDSVGAGLGFVTVGLAFGALVTQSGLQWWWAGLSAALAFGGSFEFLLIGLVTAVAPLATIGVSAFMVNVRHVFYALSFPLHRIPGRVGKTYSTFALCDEAYALAAGEQARDWTGRRIVCLQLFLHMYWVGSAIAGALLGSLIPKSVTGLDFALTALFAVLAVDAVRDLRGDVPTPVLALLSALAARLLFPGEMLLAAFGLFTAALLARHFAVNRTSDGQNDLNGQNDQNGLNGQRDQDGLSGLDGTGPTTGGELGGSTTLAGGDLSTAVPGTTLPGATPKNGSNHSNHSSGNPNHA
ncbi:AzlC family ABC transporter permease [Streptomyces sp. NPDC050617]|uniref:AzlC family ABC transporter permease n=1 Tax=Streptomyces sp. NPDC050617 TaxID=3154628 RepID=UPI003434CD71